MFEYVVNWYAALYKKGNLDKLLKNICENCYWKIAEFIYTKYLENFNKTENINNFEEYFNKNNPDISYYHITFKDTQLKFSKRKKMLQFLINKCFPI